MMRRALIAAIYNTATATPAEPFDSTLFTAAEVVATFEPGDPSRYFGLIEDAPNWQRRRRGAYALYARTGAYPHADPEPRTIIWRDCDAALRAPDGESSCASRGRSRTMPWPPEVAHNCALFRHGGAVHAIGGLAGPGRERHGLVRYAAASLDALGAAPPAPVARGDHPGCVDRRPKQRGRCEFDGKLSVAPLRGGAAALFARANLVRRNTTTGTFGGRHAQSAALDGATYAASPFAPLRIDGYREGGRDPPAPGDNVYFAAVDANPADGESLLGLFPVVRDRGGEADAFLGLALSCDGVRFSKLRRVLNSTAASFGRSTDHPVDGFAVDGDVVYFYAHRDVPGVYMDVPAPHASRIVRYAAPLDRLRAFTRDAKRDLGAACAAGASADRSPRPPPATSADVDRTDFDACWLDCLALARARERKNDKSRATRRDRFIDACFDACYPPPG